MIPFYLDKFQGDAYPTYAWGVGAIEVEVDTYTGTSKILGAYGSFDVGTPIDYNIVIGQMEGGYLQGIGYASIEHMDYDSKGRIRNNSFSDYLIPTTKDVPNLKCMPIIVWTGNSDRVCRWTTLLTEKPSFDWKTMREAASGQQEGAGESRLLLSISGRTLSSVSLFEVM